MNVEEVIAGLQCRNGKITVVTPVYELDHTQYYDEVHTIRFLAKGDEYNGTKAHKNFIVIDATR